MAIIGDDPRLAPSETDRISAEFADRHREERHGNAFAGRKQHVEFAPVGIWRNRFRQGQQFVGRISHCRNDHHHVVTGFSGPHDALGDSLEFIRIRDTAAAIFLNDNGHESSSSNRLGLTMVPYPEQRLARAKLRIRGNAQLRRSFPFGVRGRLSTI